VIIVASVSCIYGLGSPEEYQKTNIKLSVGDTANRLELMQRLITVQFERTNADLTPGTFRALGSKVEIMPVSETFMYQVIISGTKISAILKIDPITSKILKEEKDIFIFPAKHFITADDKKDAALKAIKLELAAQLKKFEKEAIAAAKLTQMEMDALMLVGIPEATAWQEARELFILTKP
jgi:excinuclease ABC subunit B